MKYTWVLPNLAVGSDPRVDEEFQELKALKITAILSLQTARIALMAESKTNEP